MFGERVHVVDPSIFEHYFQVIFIFGDWYLLNCDVVTELILFQLFLHLFQIFFCYHKETIQVRSVRQIKRSEWIVFNNRISYPFFPLLHYCLLWLLNFSSWYFNQGVFLSVLILVVLDIFWHEIIKFRNYAFVGITIFDI